MKRWFATVLIIVIGIALASPHVTGNPIPVPVGDPEKEPEFAGTVLMDLEDIQARIYSYGENLVASVEGVYRFGESYPTYATAAKMMYPIPINSSSIEVRLGGRSIDWVYSNRTFETVMGDFPVIEWNFSLPESRTFKLTVNYHHLIPFDQTDETYTFLYAMGSIRLTGYSEPTVTYSKDADVFFKVFFPSPPQNLSAMLVTPETSTRVPISHDVVKIDGEFAVTTNLVLDLSIWKMDYALRFSRGEESYPPLPTPTPPPTPSSGPTPTPSSTLTPTPQPSSTLIPLPIACYDRYPKPGSEDVPVTSNISLGFSRRPQIVELEMEPEVEISQVNKELVSIASMKYTFQLAKPLMPETTYTVRITYGQSTAPEGFSPTSTTTWQFTTSPTPTPKLSPSPSPTPQPEEELPMESIGLVLAVAFVVLVSYIYYTKLK